ncbi:MAG: helix-turn-helix domain-containing protein [Methylobacter sp.]
MIDYLQKHNRLTTIEARLKLDVMHPAARVQELKASGFNIVTHKRHVDNHRKVAEYVLLPGDPA